MSDKNPLVVIHQPFSHRIAAGPLAADGNHLLHTTDVTDSAISAVMDYVTNNPTDPIMIRPDDTGIRLTAVELTTEEVRAQTDPEDLAKFDTAVGN